MTHARTPKAVANLLTRAAKGYFAKAADVDDFLNQIVSVLEGACMSAEATDDECGEFRTTTEVDYAMDLADELIDNVEAGVVGEA